MFYLFIIFNIVGNDNDDFYIQIFFIIIFITLDLFYFCFLTLQIVRMENGEWTVLRDVLLDVLMIRVTVLTEVVNVTPDLEEKCVIKVGKLIALYFINMVNRKYHCNFVANT